MAENEEAVNHEDFSIVIDPLVPHAEHFLDGAVGMRVKYPAENVCVLSVVLYRPFIYYEADKLLMMLICLTTNTLYIVDVQTISMRIKERANNQYRLGNFEGLDQIGSARLDQRQTQLASNISLQQFVKVCQQLPIGIN